MRKVLVSIAVLSLGSTAALADPIKLSDTQLAGVSAGLSAPDHRLPGPWPGPVGPPVINPGGPILISCTVGVGCTTRHYP